MNCVDDKQLKKLLFFTVHKLRHIPSGYGCKHFLYKVGYILSVFSGITIFCWQQNAYNPFSKKMAIFDDNCSKAIDPIFAKDGPKQITCLNTNQHCSFQPYF